MHLAAALAPIADLPDKKLTRGGVDIPNNLPKLPSVLLKFTARLTSGLTFDNHSSGIEKTPHEHEGDSGAFSTAHKARPQSAPQDSRKLKHPFDESERKLVKACGEGRGDGVRSRPSGSYEPTLHGAYALRPSRPQSASTAREGPGWGSKRDGPGWGSLRAEDLPSNSIKCALWERRYSRCLLYWYKKYKH